jgi:hypothetical protein
MCVSSRFLAQLLASTLALSFLFAFAACLAPSVVWRVGTMPGCAAQQLYLFGATDCCVSQCSAPVLSQRTFACDQCRFTYGTWPCNLGGNSCDASRGESNLGRSVSDLINTVGAGAGVLLLVFFSIAVPMLHWGASKFCCTESRGWSTVVAATTFVAITFSVMAWIVGQETFFQYDIERAWPGLGAGKSVLSAPGYVLLCLAATLAFLVTVIGLAWGVKCSFDALRGEQDAHRQVRRYLRQKEESEGEQTGLLRMTVLSRA